jgi:hypothetical protein
VGSLSQRSEDHRGFLKEGVKIYLMTPITPLNSPFFSVFTSLVYMRWWILWSTLELRSSIEWWEDLLSDVRWFGYSNNCSRRVNFFLRYFTELWLLEK